MGRSGERVFGSTKVPCKTVFQNNYEKAINPAQQQPETTSSLVHHGTRLEENPEAGVRERESAAAGAKNRLVHGRFCNTRRAWPLPRQSRRPEGRRRRISCGAEGGGRAQAQQRESELEYVGLHDGIN